MHRKIYTISAIGLIALSFVALGTFSWIRSYLEEARTAQANYWGNEADMIGYFEGAKKPEMELEAAKELRARFPGYAIHAFDENGSEITPADAEDLESICRVTIAFKDWDDVASRVILKPKSLAVIYDFPEERQTKPNRPWDATGDNDSR
ncbi:hypothetical protein JIN85_19670 [Luteolibacter pohnpeiensis]|uniref:Uncharacterized protein n=1 Tax=Luteolibacter pohnpeiensis TaxID=454153 RepID=A0A934VYL5_9BACT|nr:hypothetical protein [Luteolibacter pohnpeiensis]MBK1884644.1 hypothetical protein [Luteolibacter pohnpeiensis]